MRRLALLLVDDDPFALEMQAYVAGEALPGSQITTTASAGEVAALCATTAFDCILLDYDMPELDGLSLASRLRDEHPYLAIVLCTGAGDELLAARAMQSGVTDYIPKSAIRPPALRRTVLHAIEAAQNTRIIAQQRTELETFAFALAHDFKQPLRQIGTFSNLAVQDLEQGELEEARRHLEFLARAARRLSNLVDMMSQYTLLNKAIELEVVRIGAVLEGVIDSLRTYIEERAGVVNVQGDAEVLGNSVFLHQVLQNLIVNGLKYNQSETPRVEVRISIEAETCTVVVGDNGIGIDAENLEQIFQPLARLHANAEYAGTGLGLTMARKAAAALGGTVVCRSALGEGSEFIVCLPLPPRASAVDARAEGEPPGPAEQLRAG